jgi:putative DNA primase/helicase
MTRRYRDEADLAELAARGEPMPDVEDNTRLVSLPGAFALTDIGNAERFVARNRDQVRYCPQRRKWLMWEQTRWLWDERGYVQHIAKLTVRSIYEEAAKCPDDEQRKAIVKHARDSEKASRVHSMLALAQGELGMPVLMNELDADPYVLGCPNGALDLRTGKLRPHRRRDLITKSTCVCYDANAKSELWDRVLYDATGGDAELAAYLQRVVGYALIGEPLERVFFFLFGPPGTAKSTLILAFHAALGDYAASAAFETWLLQSNVGGNRGDLVRLAGARLVTSVEVNHGARWDAALIKSVTGGDDLVAAAKFEAEVSFRAGFTLVLAANDAPSAREDDAGLWARLKRIPLTAQIPPERQDPSIKTKLREPENAAAVLAWAVAGCLAYQRDGLGSCAAVELSTREYRQDLDHFAEFLSDACVFEDAAKVTRRELRESYKAWCDETGRRSLLNDREVAGKLRDRGCKDHKARGTRLWVGVRLRLPTESGGQGAPEIAVSREVVGDGSLVGSLGNESPKCPMRPKLPGFDDPDERAAIQDEGAK